MKNTNIETIKVASGCMFAVGCVFAIVKLTIIALLIAGLVYVGYKATVYFTSNTPQPQTIETSTTNEQ